MPVFTALSNSIGEEILLLVCKLKRWSYCCHVLGYKSGRGDKIWSEIEYFDFFSNSNCLVNRVSLRNFNRIFVGNVGLKFESEIEATKGLAEQNGH